MSDRTARRTAGSKLVELTRRRRGQSVLAAQIALLPLGLVVWEIVSTRTALVPGVGATVDALVDGFSSGRYLAPLWSTIEAVLLGVGVALLAGVCTAVVLGRSRFLGRVFDPIVNSLFAVPRIILYPILLVSLGTAEAPKIWIAAIAAYFPIVINGAAAIRSLNPVLPKMARSLSASRLQTLRYVVLPSAMPMFAVTLRIGWSGGFVTVVIAEIFASRIGLGQLLNQAYTFQQYPQMFALVLLLVLIAFAGNLLLILVERRVSFT
jgi:NitT/TauT family transport system permease protein